MWEWSSIALLGIGTGLLAGCTGIGGVFLVPALVYWAGVPIQVGIPAVMMAFILSGTIGMTVFARSRSIRWDMAAWLFAGAAPTAFAGSWAISAVNPILLQAFLSASTIFSGLHTLLKQNLSIGQERKRLSGVLLPIGGLTGFLSSITGTGGAVVLMPILLSMSVPVLTTIGLSQAIQLPIAIAATFGSLMYGNLDLRLGGILAITFTLGIFPGAKLAHLVPNRLLRQIVSAMLLAVGLFILANMVWRSVG